MWAEDRHQDDEANEDEGRDKNEDGEDALDEKEP